MKTKMKFLLIATVLVMFLLPSTLFVASGINDSSSGDDKGIDDYINGLKYDPDASIALKTTPTQVPSSSYSHPEGKTVTVYYTKKNASNDPTGILTNSEEISTVTYPGSLLTGDHDLAGNRPNAIYLKRAPITLNIDLNGLKSGGKMVVDPTDYANVYDAISKKCAEWAETGNKRPSSYTYTFTKAESERQLEVKLGVSAKQLQGLNIGFNWVSKDTETVYVVKFTQVYYNVSATLPMSPSMLFDSSVTLKDVQNKIHQGNQAVAVTDVVYGRTVLVAIKSNESSKTIDAAISAAIKGSKESLNAKYKDIINNCETKVFVYGGNLTLPNDIFEVKKQLKDCIVTGKEIEYAKPISYKTAFIDHNNKTALCKNSTEYYEKKVIETKPITFSYHFTGAFNSRCKITYQTFEKMEFTETGVPIYVGLKTKTYESGLIWAGNRSSTTFPENHLPTFTMSVLGRSCKDVMTNRTFTPMESLHYDHWGTTCNQHIKVLVDGNVVWNQ